MTGRLVVEGRAEHKPSNSVSVEVPSVTPGGFGFVGTEKPSTMVGGATTVAKPEYSSSRCWGDLPTDIIDSILGRLTLLADYDRFGAVCSTWRRSSLDPINRNRRIESSLCSSSPLLILSPDYHNGKSPEEKPCKFTLFDVVRGNTELTLPPIPYAGELFYGSSHGWLIFADGNYSLTLINPFYMGGGGGGGVIRLPRPPDPKDNYISKVVLSADPSLSPNDYMVFVIYGFDNSRALFITPGDNDWSCIKGRDFYSPHFYIDDLVFHNGLLYAVDQQEGFYVCDIFKEPLQCFDLLCFVPPTPDGLDRWCYIVQSPDDDELILVYIVRSPDVRDLPEFQFRVYKLLLAPGGTATWHEMKNLGSDSKAIILGRNHSVCIKRCHAGFQPNSIYFLNDNFRDASWRLTDPAIQEVGIYNMETGNRSIRKCHQRVDLAQGVEFSTPDWFFPSLPRNWKQVS